MEALINMVCELKITAGCKKRVKNNKNSMVMEYSVISEKHGYAAYEIHSKFIQVSERKKMKCKPVDGLYSSFSYRNLKELNMKC